MLSTAAIIFAVAALGGVVLAAHVLRARFAPWALSLLHAALGAAGIVLVLVAVLQGAAPSRATLALVLFVVAALGGFFLASFHYRQKLPPAAVVIVHALVAVAGFGVLLSALGFF
jgi:hypothetical protein